MCSVDETISSTSYKHLGTERKEGRKDDVYYLTRRSADNIEREWDEVENEED